MQNISLWQAAAEKVDFPQLNKDIVVDVAIVGGGITGVTAAYLLSKAGKTVVLLEAWKIGESSTGYSTGNLYETVGKHLHTIESKHDKKTTAAIVESRGAAVNFIEQLVKEFNISCDFRRVPWYFFTDKDGQESTIDKEKKAAGNTGLKATSDTPPLPFAAKTGIKIDNQAQFNPMQYVKAFARNIVSPGCSVFENTKVEKVEEGKTAILHTAHGKVTAKQVIMATHTPKGVYAVHTAMGPYREYAIAVKLKGGYPPDGIYWNSQETQHVSIRPYSTGSEKFLLVLGESHKVGQKENNEENYGKLEEYARRFFDVESVEYKWSAQNYQPADGLPYIGKSSADGEIYIATGFAADGLTYGTLAAMIISDQILGIENKWAKIYAPTRFTPVASAKDFIKENVNVGAQYMKDVPFKGDEKEFAGIAAGEGKVMEIKGEKCAVYRDENKNLQVVSAVCTHMECIVNWNSMEKSWDCPCHGSRFTTDGKVIEGPALADLGKKLLS